MMENEVGGIGFDKSFYVSAFLHNLSFDHCKHYHQTTVACCSTVVLGCVYSLFFKLDNKLPASCVCALLSYY